MESENAGPTNYRPHNQIMFIEFTKWNPGQHFILVKYASVDNPKAISIARVYLQLDENRKATYISKDMEGNEFFPPSKNLIELKNQFKAYGKNLSPEKEPEKEQQPGQVAEQKPVQNHTINRKPKAKGNSIER